MTNPYEPPVLGGEQLPRKGRRRSRRKWWFHATVLAVAVVSVLWSLVMVVLLVSRD